ncbi:MAG: KAP family P-loop NTPase fold protein [Pseudonocardia sp.]
MRPSHHDKPIDEPGQDRLDRLAFAGQACRVLREVAAGTESTVLAVIGPWGSGKSSVMNLIRGSLADDPGGRPISTVEFNPWMASDLGDLARDFFSTVSGELHLDDTWKSKFRNYGRKLAPLTGLLGAVLPGAEAVGQAVTDRVLADRSLESERDELAAALRGMSGALLVVIDDLDRLHPDELLMVFKLVRLAGRLPNVHYLLGFDERTILDLLIGTDLARDHEDRALAYLEKIVQIRLDLPPVYPSRLAELLDKALGDVVDATGVRPLHLDRPTVELLVECGLDGPRRIYRLAAQYGAVAPLLDGEVHDIDLLLLTFVRTFHPTYWRRLGTLRDSLTRTPGDDDPLRMLLLEAPLSIRLVLEHVFPAVSGPVREESPAAGEEQVAAQRASSPDYFERYWTLGVPPGDVGDGDISQTLGAITSLRPEDTLDSLGLERFEHALQINPGSLLRKLSRLSGSAGDPGSRLRLAALVHRSLCDTYGPSAAVVHDWAGELLHRSHGRLTEADFDGVLSLVTGRMFLTEAVIGYIRAFDMPPVAHGRSVRDRLTFPRAAAPALATLQRFAERTIELLPLVEEALTVAHSVEMSSLFPGAQEPSADEDRLAELTKVIGERATQPGSLASINLRELRTELYAELRCASALALVDPDRTREWLLPALDGPVDAVLLLAECCPIVFTNFEPTRVHLVLDGDRWPFGAAVTPDELRSSASRLYRAGPSSRPPSRVPASDASLGTRLAFAADYLRVSRF